MAENKGDFEAGVSRVWEAFSKPFRYTTASDQIEPAPQELKDFCRDVGSAAAGGLVYGALREASILRKEGPVENPVGVPLQVKNRVLFEENTLRLLRFMNGALSGAVRVGGFTAIFLGAGRTVALARDEEDFINTAAGAVVSTGLFGFWATKGSGAIGRMQGLVLGSVVGLAVGVPLGMALDAANRAVEESEYQERHGSAPEGRGGAAGARAPSHAPLPKADSTLGAIMVLEESLLSRGDRYKNHVKQLEAQLKDLRTAPRCAETDQRKSELKRDIKVAQRHHAEFLREDADMAGIVADQMT